MSMSLGEYLTKKDRKNRKNNKSNPGQWYLCWALHRTVFRTWRLRRWTSRAYNASSAINIKWAESMSKFRTELRLLTHDHQMMCRDRSVPLGTDSPTILRLHVWPKDIWRKTATSLDQTVYCWVAQSVSQIRPGLMSQLCFIFCTTNSVQLLFPPTTMRFLMSGLLLEAQVPSCSYKVDDWESEVHSPSARLLRTCNWQCGTLRKQDKRDHPSSSAFHNRS